MANNNSSANVDLSRIQNGVNGCLALIGLFFSGFNVIVLIFLNMIRKKKGYFFLLCLGVSSFLTLFLYIPIPAYDERIMRHDSYFWAFYRWRVALWAANALEAANAYFILCMCIDRFVALYFPLSYNKFINFKISILLAAFCLIMGVCCGSQWHGRFHLTLRVNGMYDVTDAASITSSEGWKIACSIFQYYLTALFMIVLTAFNVRKMQRLAFQYQASAAPQGDGNNWKLRAKKMKISMRICIALVVIWCIAQLSASALTYVYAAKRRSLSWFPYVLAIINVIEILGLELNLLLFSCLSKEYRDAFVHLLLCRCFRRGRVKVWVSGGQRLVGMKQRNQSRVSTVLGPMERTQDNETFMNGDVQL